MGIFPKCYQTFYIISVGNLFNSYLREFLEGGRIEFSSISALVLQCSTNWTMKTHTLEAGQIIELILTPEENEN